ncbi:MAG: hypothetical protein NVS3B10_12780 [Polyangiales bacterium]
MQGFLDSWMDVIDRVLRPRRPRLTVCLRERERHLDARRPVAEERARAIARCVANIEAARAAVFDANDGVVASRMTELEREWRRLSRPDPDAGLMDLWARVAPPSWIDRTRWRDSDPAARIDAAIALAADVEGVEAAEGAIGSLRVALATWGTPIGSRIRWRAVAHDAECAAPLLAETLRAAQEAIAERGAEATTLERARALERDVHAAALLRFPDRALLARELSRAAFVDCMLHASVVRRTNPVSALRELWRTGYVLAAIDASGTTVELPPL